MGRRNQHGVYCIFTSMEMGQHAHLEDAPVPHRGPELSQSSAASARSEPRSTGSNWRQPVSPVYCKIAETGCEVPTPLVLSVTVTESTDEGLPVTVNGCVRVNSLPNCDDAEL